MGVREPAKQVAHVKPHVGAQRSGWYQPLSEHLRGVTEYIYTSDNPQRGLLNAQRSNILA